ncbi:MULTISPECIES: hypothetical protein [unclassified Variovorax]|uniref:hypothetical protein n=1 Tax=unclassified Variovorax TaxID=663243 RepID=UPI000F7E0C54|nr:MULTISPECIES: hypothetical protein [unclassified Variovorax]RSZ29983.1 hypothetical protein EJO70_33310 [Variovorax sp. 553]RSZ30464.1 hypothetical protein EJO71_33185 [Variovorax sp. 679]
MRGVRRATFLLALALGGCSAFDAHSFDHSAGWRAAQVVSVGRTGDLVATADRDCGADGGADARYAVVRYRNGGVHTRSLGTGRWPAGAALKVGDAVEVNILDCAAPLALAGQRGSMPGAPSR